MITIKIFIPRKPIEPNLERISIFEIPLEESYVREMEQEVICKDVL